MINTVRLINFRNYVDRLLSLAPFTVIVGANGLGKTNIIEALFMLSTGRSFRTTHDRELIRFGQPFARLVCDPIDLTIVGGERTKKQARIHGKPARLLQVLGVHPSVLFTPSSLSLVDGSPSVRRQFIDILLSQVNPTYAHHLLEYQRTLKQRNELLHQIQAGMASSESLSLWDDLLVQSSLPVLQARKIMVTSMGEPVLQWYNVISPDQSDRLGVQYISSVEKRHTGSESKLESLFYERLRERRPAEIQAGRTLIGPHRDDFAVSLNGHEIVHFGSRGQMRSAVVALKMFEFQYMTERIDVAPTLLFDDVFSELDPYRRAAVLTIAPEAQMILTTTDLKHFGRLPARATVIDLGQ